MISGTSLNVIHNTTTNNAKKELSFKIKRLMERLLSDKNIFTKINSRYHFFNKQSISYFPKKSKEKLDNDTETFTEICKDNEIKLLELLKLNPNITQVKFSDELNLSRRTISSQFKTKK